jgi:hypothetical protein
MGKLMEVCTSRWLAIGSLVVLVVAGMAVFGFVSAGGSSSDQVQADLLLAPKDDSQTLLPGRNK